MSKWGNHQQGLHRNNVHDKTKREDWSSVPEFLLIYSSVHTRSVPLYESHLTSIELLEVLTVDYDLLVADNSSVHVCIANTGVVLLLWETEWSILHRFSSKPRDFLACTSVPYHSSQCPSPFSQGGCLAIFPSTSRGLHEHRQNGNHGYGRRCKFSFLPKTASLCFDTSC